MENDFFKPTQPKKVWKIPYFFIFYFWRLPLGKGSIKKKKKSVEFSTLLDRTPPPYYIVSVENQKKNFMV